MRRLAFLLGFYSACSQVLLLRELVSSFNGDELFIGTALFGWLVAVAVGAYFGGRISSRTRPVILLVIGALLLQIMVTAARLSPLLVVDTVGEYVPFSIATLFSILLMLPVSLISGLLFPAVARSGWDSERSIVDVYLFEGIGAFVGGVLIALAVGSLHSTLTVAAIVGLIIILGSFPGQTKKATYILTALTLLLLAGSFFGGFYSDSSLDGIKFRGYRVLSSFDTPYGHQVLLERDSSFVLITDNLAEATYPNPETDENLLLPPLLYQPNAHNVLLLGRGEFGLAQLADSIPGMKLTAVDPRGELSEVLDNNMASHPGSKRITNDPVTYLGESGVNSSYDIILTATGPLDNYRTDRKLTPRFLGTVKAALKAGGVVAYTIPYDTERYVTPATERLISTIFRTFADVFPYVKLWPGNQTMILASTDADLKVPLDSLTARLSRLPFQPAYLDAYRLKDRLETLRIDRLESSLNPKAPINSLERPLLPYYHIAWRTQAGGIEKALVFLITQGRWWVIALPLTLLAFLTLSIAGRQSRTRFSLFLYLVAGAVSLSLELISFYLYQSTAGSLYSELAILIGTFMLGLSFGAYFSRHTRCPGLEYPALALLFLTAIVLLLTYNSVPHPALLFYHAFFLFAVATGTGALFVAATNRYYSLTPFRNRGSGYAFELVGSALGALLTTTLLLPLLGLSGLLAALLLLVAAAVVGSVITRRV